MKYSDKYQNMVRSIIEQNRDPKKFDTTHLIYPKFAGGKNVKVNRIPVTPTERMDLMWELYQSGNHKYTVNILCTIISTRQHWPIVASESTTYRKAMQAYKEHQRVRANEQNLSRHLVKARATKATPPRPTQKIWRTTT